MPIDPVELLCCKLSAETNFAKVPEDVVHLRGNLTPLMVLVLFFLRLDFIYFFSF